MPRPRGETQGRSEAEIMIDELMAGNERDWRDDPATALERLGELDAETVRQHAREVVAHCDHDARLVAIGAIKTSSPSAAESMAARRDQKRAGWVAVIEAVG